MLVGESDDLLLLVVLGLGVVVDEFEFWPRHKPEPTNQKEITRTVLMIMIATSLSKFLPSAALPLAVQTHFSNMF